MISDINKLKKKLQLKQMSGSRKVINEKILKYGGPNNLSSFLLGQFAHIDKKDGALHFTHHFYSARVSVGHVISLWGGF